MLVSVITGRFKRFTETHYSKASIYQQFNLNILFFKSVPSSKLCLYSFNLTAIPYAIKANPYEFMGSRGAPLSISPTDNTLVT